MSLPDPARRRVVSFAAIVALSASAGAVLAALALAPEPDRTAAPANRSAVAAPAPADGSDEYAQSYSPYCQTAQGVCTLPSALPIGSPCDCGGTPGRVIP